MQTFDSGLVWLRRDLRLTDHAALHAALSRCRRVWCVFVFDSAILEPLRARGLGADRRVEFILESLREVDAGLHEAGSTLLVRYGDAQTLLPQIAAELGAEVVFFNHDYEPAAIARDNAVTRQLQAERRSAIACKDQVIFENDDILSAAGTPYSVYTPYRNAWHKMLTQADVAPHVIDLSRAIAPLPAGRTNGLPTLEEIGFAPTNLRSLKVRTGMSGAHSLLDDFLSRIGGYGTTRDYPAVKGPSYLSVHSRFGTISIRTLVRAALAYSQGIESGGASIWLNELIWREFYFQILAHHPHVVNHAFKPAYDAIAWDSGDHADALFAAWCAGRTGYPLVDAAMTQLNQTGYMHNRLRMVTASFFTKDLGLDWRRGEAYFADRLIDYDLAANNGGWQWAASTGCDAQPYFRIFNPVSQSEKFDPEGKFIKRYLPQLAGLAPAVIHAPWRVATTLQGIDYPSAIVDHALARERTLARYAVVKSWRKSGPASLDP